MIQAFSSIEPASEKSPEIQDMFSELSPRYDLLNHCLSFGRDIFWRRSLAQRLKAESPQAHFLDLATGTGDQLFAIKQLWPQACVTGLDFSKPMLDIAQNKLQKNCLTEPFPELVEADATKLTFTESSFDSVSIAFGLRNITDRQALYRSVLKVLKPGGRFLVLELFFDKRHPLAFLYRLHLKFLTPFLASVLFHSNWESYLYLARTVLAFPHPALIADEIKQAGFTDLDLTFFTFRTVMLVWGHKPL
jgi:demethylmenaquinone methyltransferase/2-methoxy-6-polyprenyl-1,4-benzoquinol methylase